MAEEWVPVLGIPAPAPESTHFSPILGFIGTSAPVISKEWTIPRETVTFHLWATGELYIAVLLSSL